MIVHCIKLQNALNQCKECLSCRRSPALLLYVHLHLCIVLHLHSCRFASTSSPAFVQCAPLQCLLCISCRISSTHQHPAQLVCQQGDGGGVLHGGCILHFAKDLREKFSARCVLVGQAACDPANCILAASSNQQAAIKADALQLSIQLDQNDTFRPLQWMQCALLYRNNNSLTLKYAVFKLNYAGCTWHLMLVDELQLTTQWMHLLIHTRSNAQ